MSHRTVLYCLILISAVTSAAQAHYPWLKSDRDTGEQGAVLFHFEHAPKAGDGRYLDPFVKRGKTWLNVPGGKPEEIALEETQDGKLRWLQSELNALPPRAVDSYAPWGVYRYGKTDVMLHYYARNIDADRAEAIARLSGSKQLKLQLQPRLRDGKLSVRVTWDGEALANQKVHLRSPNISRSYKTGSDGVVEIAVTRGGEYALRTKLVEDKPGQFDGSDYAETHHHSTLVMRLAGKEALEK